MTTFGATFYEANSPRGAADRKAISDRGITGFHQVVGEEEITTLFNDTNTLREGDTLFLPRADSLGRHAAQRANRLRLTASLGVLVQVSDGEPVLYDSEDRVAEFRAHAAAARREQLGKSVVRNRRRAGRPSDIQISDDHRQAVCEVWWDGMVNGGPRAVSLASKLTGADVQLHHVKTWCGPTRTKPTDDTKEVPNGEEPLELDE